MKSHDALWPSEKRTTSSTSGMILDEAHPRHYLNIEGISTSIYFVSEADDHCAYDLAGIVLIYAVPGSKT